MGHRHLTHDGFNGALIVGSTIDSKLFAQAAFLLLRVHGQTLVEPWLRKAWSDVPNATK